MKKIYKLTVLALFCVSIVTIAQANNHHYQNGNTFYANGIMVGDHQAMEHHYHHRIRQILNSTSSAKQAQDPHGYVYKKVDALMQKRGVLGVFSYQDTLFSRNRPQSQKISKQQQAVIQAINKQIKPKKSWSIEYLPNNKHARDIAPVMQQAGRTPDQYPGLHRNLER